MKTALIIMGSHRSKGGTSLIASWAKEIFESQNIKAEIMNINNLNIKHCLDCGHCQRHFGSCVIADDMKKVYNAFKAYDYVCFASPVYFNGVTSKLKTLIDRNQVLYMCEFVHKKAFRDKPGKGFQISIGGAPHYPHQFVGSELTVGLVFRNLRIKSAGHLQYADTDRQSIESREIEIKNDLEKLIGSII